MFREMLRHEALQAAIAELHREGRIGLHHPDPGAVAANVGAVSALEATDFHYPAHGDLAPVLWRGLPLSVIARQLLGSASDGSRGRGLPTEIGSRALRVVPVSASFGTRVLQAVGTALAAKARGESAIASVAFGTRAAARGGFHVAMRLAFEHDLPIVFLARSHSATSGDNGAVPDEGIAERARAHGIDATTVDGEDILAVHHGVGIAAERARGGEGPTLVEAILPRPVDEDANEGAAPGPIDRFRSFLDTQGLVTDAKEAEIRTEIDAELREAIEDAKSEAAPAPETLFDDVFASVPASLAEQRSAISAGTQNLDRTGEDAR